MRTYRAVLLALLAVGGAVVAAAPASAGATDDVRPVNDVRPAEVAERVVTDAARQSAEANNSTNATLGGDISSFMQSSVAEVSGEVESEMWEAAFNGTQNRSERVELVDRRTRELERELADVRERKQEIIDQHESGALGDTAYRARLSNVVGRIEALRSSINTTTPHAKQVDTDVTELQNLSEQTEDLSGPEIAAVARNTSGNGLGAGRNGPPSGVGNASESVGVANGSVGNGVSNGVGNANRSNGNGVGNGVGLTNPSGDNPGNGQGSAGNPGKPVEDRPGNGNRTVEPPNGSDVTGPTLGNNSTVPEVTANDSDDDGLVVADAFDASSISFSVPSIL